MGAIAGLFYPASPKPVDPARVRAMADAMAHRGPDGGGSWTALGIGLAHRRLALLDRAGSSQPMLSADGRYAIVLDGSIYNHRAVRAELGAAGVLFSSGGDAEVVLQGFAAWGPSVLERLDGAFAMAIHDAATQTLFLARDRIGEKPLHLAELADGALAFASELKGLLAHPLMRRAPDARAAEDYLAFGHVPDDACLVTGVRKLPAGHFLLVERGRPATPTRRWWSAEPVGGVQGGMSADAALLALMRDAVRARMEAEVPVGAMLSPGGGDTALVALMAEASPRAISTSIVAVDADDTEAVARRYATRHRVQRLPVDPLTMLPTLAQAFDEPCGDPAIVALAQAADFARDGMTVALTGGGAAEMIAHARIGRMLSRAEGARSIVPAHWRAALRDSAVLPQAVRRLLTEDEHAARVRAVTVVSPDARAGLWSEDGRRALDGYRAEARGAWPAGDLPTRLDRIGMAMGLELRTPWLDHRVIGFLAALPPAARIADRRGRGPIERAAARHVPDDLPRDGRAQAAPPVDEWIRGALAAQVALLPRSRILDDLGWFDLAHLGRLIDAHRIGRGDHGRLLWQMLLLERSLTRLFG